MMISSSIVSIDQTRECSSVLRHLEATVGLDCHASCKQHLHAEYGVMQCAANTTCSKAVCFVYCHLQHPNPPGPSQLGLPPLASRVAGREWRRYPDLSVVTTLVDYDEDDDVAKTLKALSIDYDPPDSSSVAVSNVVKLPPGTLTPEQAAELKQQRQAEQKRQEEQKQRQQQLKQQQQQQQQQQLQQQQEQQKHIKQEEAAPDAGATLAAAAAAVAPPRPPAGPPPQPPSEHLLSQQ